MPNPFDQFDEKKPASNPFDKFDLPEVGSDKSTFGSFARGLAQGGSLGFADEFFSAVESARLKLGGDNRSFGELFDLHQRALAVDIGASREANPKTFLASEIAGGLGTALAASPVGLVARTAGRGLAARTLAGAGEGAGFGALVGAGTAEGDLTDRAVGAGVGAGTGLAFGAAVPGIAAGAGALVSAGKRPFQEATTKATTLIADRLKNAQTNLQRALTRLESVRKQSPNATLADVGGPEVQKLLRAAANVPSEGRTGLLRRLNRRQGFQFKRLSDAVSVAAGGSTDEFFETLTGLGNLRKANAGPAFDKAFEKAIPFTPELESVLQRPIVRAALKRAQEAASNRGEKFEQIFARETGVDAAGLPVFEITAVPGTRDLHRVKVAVDQIISNIRNRRETTSLGNMQVRDAVIAKKALVDAIDNPEYKQALAQYAGDSAVIDAGERGFKEGLKLDPGQIKEIMTGFGSETERQMFRLGFARALVDRIKNRPATNDAVKPVLENVQNIERFKAVFPNAGRRELQKAAAIENLQTRTLREVQGQSTTAQQLLEAQAAGGVSTADVAALGTDILTGGAAGASVANAARRTVLRTVGDRLKGLSPDVADEVISQLTNANPDVLRSVTQQLGRLSEAQRRNLTLQDISILGLTGTTTGLAVP